MVSKAGVVSTTGSLWVKAVVSKAGEVSTVCSVEAKAVASNEGIASTASASPNVFISTLVVVSKVVCTFWYSLIFICWLLKLASVSIGLGSTNSWIKSVLS